VLLYPAAVQRNARAHALAKTVPSVKEAAEELRKADSSRAEARSEWQKWRAWTAQL